MNLIRKYSKWTWMNLLTILSRMKNQRDKFRAREVEEEQLHQHLRKVKARKINKKRILRQEMMHQIQMIINHSLNKAKVLKNQVMRNQLIRRVHPESNKMEMPILSKTKTNNQLTKINNNSLNNSLKGVRLLLKVEEFKMMRSNNLSF